MQDCIHKKGRGQKVEMHQREKLEETYLLPTMGSSKTRREQMLMRHRQITSIYAMGCVVETYHVRREKKVTSRMMSTTIPL